MVLHIDLYLLLGRQVPDDGGKLESACLEIRQEDLKDQILIGVVANGGGSLHYFAHLQCRQVDLIVRQCQIRPCHLHCVVQVQLRGGDFACDYFASYAVLLPVIFAIGQTTGIEVYVCP